MDSKGFMRPIRVMTMTRRVISGFPRHSIDSGRSLLLRFIRSIVSIRVAPIVLFAFHAPWRVRFICVSFFVLCRAVHER